MSDLEESFKTEEGMEGEKEEQVTALQAELSEIKQRYQFALAEGENMRKRLLNEQRELLQRAKESLILDLLAPIDCFEQALSYEGQMSDEVKQWAVGFKMILSQFHQFLAQSQVTSFAPLGELFDPAYHEAVEVIEGEKEGEIVEVIVKGYKVGQKVLRPAKVKVVKSVELE